MRQIIVWLHSSSEYLLIKKYFRASEKLKIDKFEISPKPLSLKVYKCLTPHLVNNFIWELLSVMMYGGRGTSQTGNYQVNAKYLWNMKWEKDSSHLMQQHRKFTVIKCVKCLHFYRFPLYRFGFEIEIYLLWADEPNQSNI